MAGENTVSTANGLFKVVYAKKLQKAVPDFAVLQKLVPFAQTDKEIGSYFAQPVSLSHEAGFTYNGTAGGVVQLKAAANAVIKEAQVYGSELVLRTQLSNLFITRASSKGEKAFEKATAFKVFDMNNSMRKRLEIAMLYGQSGVGTVESATDLGGSVAEIVITEATWAGGIWAGAEGARLDSFTGTTKNNASGVLTITKVDSDSRKLTVTYTGTLASEVAASDELYFESANAGSSSFNEMAGLKKIISNSGTLFNIDAATYSLWKGTSVASVGALTNAKLQSYVARAVNKGLMEKCVVLVSPKGWGALNADMAALRMFDSSFKSSKGENGFENLSFYSQNGELEVMAHPLVKDGDAFILPIEAMQRIGSVDVQFGLPGGDDKYFTWLPEYNAVELRCISDQAIFLDRPAQAIYLSGITYS
jgi:hypothetical protein